MVAAVLMPNAEGKSPEFITADERWGIAADIWDASGIPTWARGTPTHFRPGWPKKYYKMPCGQRRRTNYHHKLARIADIDVRFREPVEERLRSILSGIVLGAALPPISVTGSLDTEPYRYTLHDGFHRLHCSLAAGYSEIPIVVVR